ncbi:MAG TPA: 1-phosphofructokinase family hexose kinase [Bdellovibrio sp.]|uniref:1-phosphofructokinase family hexose kinase n=1 Tax=Bdellovibrio sp. TaxID=28201 RepID=UPI002F203C5F
MKKVIYTITPNPALDLSGTVKDLKPNEKAYVQDEKRAPGGNAINAARILHRLQVPVVASGFLGGSTGEEIEGLLRVEGLRSEFIKIQESTRINVTISNLNDHQQTRLSFAGPMLKPVEKKKFFHFINNKNDMDILLIGGSLPKNFSVKDLVHLMAVAQRKGVRIIVDCPGDILSKAVLGKPFLIKPNLEEFQVMTGLRGKSIGAVRKKAETLLNSVKYVCVSSVEGGALLVTQEGAYFGRIPKIKIRSTVGAGDSMVGAMVSQIYHQQESPEEILRWGLAAAAATLSETGTTLGKVANIKKLYKKTTVEKI